MKIVVNYDLIDRIKEAQEDPKFTLVKKQAKYYGIVYGYFVALTLFIRQKELTDALSSGLIQTTILMLLWNIRHGFFSLMMTKDRVTAEQLKVVRDLLSLISQLGERNINTCLEYLYEAEAYKTKHRIMKEEGKIHLMQEKYIMIPTYTFTGDRKDVSLLQEHVIGSKEYVLSLGSPKKATKLVPAFGSI